MKLLPIIVFRFVFSIHSLLLLLISSENVAHARVIKTKLGSIEGAIKVARNQRYFLAYYGIPYAKAPVGNLRFEPPVEADPWKGIFNATQPPDPCPQFDSKIGAYKGAENCLFLHVFTPMKARPGSKVPVIFYIFGGAFESGDPSEEGPEFLMSRDIVLVQVSHRLGALGFLSTGDTVLPGNMGMKDQVLAMRWTKENIRYFGGDPDKITLHGHSSGAISVHLHTLSPLSRDYFSQAIMQSGVGVSLQSFWDADTARSVAVGLAERVNCSTTSSKTMKKCLQKKNLRNLLLATDELFIWQKVRAPIIFKPVIEAKGVKNAFLSDNPLFAQHASQSKPWLLGMTSDEAAEIVSTYLVNCPEVLEGHPKLWFPLISSFIWTSKPNHIDYIVQLAKTYFFTDKIGKHSATAIVKLLTGIMWGKGLIDAVQKYQGVKYLYLFDYHYVGGYTEHVLAEDLPYLGIGHSDELAIIFNRTNGENITAEDFAFGDEMITRWVNFAYSGNPNIPFPIDTNVFGAWEPISTSRMEYLHITNNGSMGKDYFLQEYGFWKSVPLCSKYYT